MEAQPENAVTRERQREETEEEQAQRYREEEIKKVRPFDPMGPLFPRMSL